MCPTGGTAWKIMKQRGRKGWRKGKKNMCVGKLAPVATFKSRCLWFWWERLSKWPGRKPSSLSASCLYQTHSLTTYNSPDVSYTSFNLGYRGNPIDSVMSRITREIICAILCDRVLPLNSLRKVMVTHLRVFVRSVYYKWNTENTSIPFWTSSAAFRVAKHSALCGKYILYTCLYCHYL